MRQKVYLAGGFHTSWQEQVKRNTRKLITTRNGREIIYDELFLQNQENYIESFEWLDPKEKEFINGQRVNLPLELYTTYDLHAIKRCDILFLYHEKTNPGVGGLIEAGYAKGLGKTVITVLEKENPFVQDRYLEFVRGVSDVTFTNLESGIDYLYLLK